ncbi:MULTISPECIES: hypothetical protein [unclassified Microcoleus]|uniref:hypothetical protein n=1 Tax=unclassified Microcoleus TaxID=2642155 RepID=UPI002FD41F64
MGHGASGIGQTGHQSLVILAEERSRRLVIGHWSFYLLATRAVSRLRSITA